jgi:hypothetical protein
MCSWLIFDCTLMVCSIYSKHTSHRQSRCTYGIAKYSCIYHLATEKKKRTAESTFWKRNIFFCHGMLVFDHGQIWQSGQNTGKWPISDRGIKELSRLHYTYCIWGFKIPLQVTVHDCFVTDHLLVETIYVPHICYHKNETVHQWLHRSPSHTTSIM